MTRLTPVLVLVLVALTAGCASADADTDPASAADVSSPPDAFAARLIDRAEADELVLVLGPVDVPVSDPAGEGHHGYGVLPPPQKVRFPKAVHLTGFRYEVVDGEGRALPSSVLHHMNLINPHRRELFLPISQRMLAVGSETGGQELPGWLLGMPVPEGTEAVASVMLHNQTGEPLSDVSVRLILEYEESDGLLPFLDIYPFQVDVQFPAGDKQFDLPPGRSEHAWEGQPALEGRIMALGSHLHEHAVRIVFEDVTTGERIWEGLPVEDEEGHLTGVTVGRLYWELGEPIHPDHTYRATVVYDNPTGDTLEGGGMGVVAGAFLPADGPWPAPDSTNRLYELDRRHYLRQVSGSYEELADSTATAAAGPGHAH